MDNTTKRLQLLLIAAGFDPGEPDGIPGRKTQAATSAFQRSIGLPGGGVAGPKTWAALIKVEGEIIPSQAAPPWIDFAEQYLGIAEKPGKGSNPVIMGMVEALGPNVGMDYRDDDTPWCGVFVGFVIATALPEEPIPNIAVRAKAWAGFGVSVVGKIPFLPYGAVGVWNREGGGHVGFIVGEEEGFYYSLGGNQGNKVSILKLATDRVLDVRWPATIPTNQAVRAPRLIGGKLSVNER